MRPERPHPDRGAARQEGERDILRYPGPNRGARLALLAPAASRYGRYSSLVDRVKHGPARPVLHPRIGSQVTRSDLLLMVQEDRQGPLPGSIDGA
jgi:hypothetical protein